MASAGGDLAIKISFAEERINNFNALFTNYL